MTRIANIAKCFAVTAALVVAAVAGTSSATAGTPVGGFAAGPGCSVSCITSAVVTQTASSASVKVTTSAPTSTTVSVRRLDAQLGLAAGPQPTDIVVLAFAMTRTVLFPGLAPETSYRISVTARDIAGRKETRTGTFKTLAVKVAVDLPDLDLSAGLGCKADCIERGTVKAHASAVGRVDFDVRLTEPGRIELKLYRGNGTGGLALQRTITTSNGVEKLNVASRGLVTGAKYTVRLKATDGRGQSRIEWGSFRTASARAIVIFHKLAVLADGEVGDGEIAFDYFVADLFVYGNGYHKRGSGDTVAAVASGTSRQTVTIATSIDGQTKLDVGVRGTECDAVLMKNCLFEPWNAGYRGSAGVAVSLPELLNPVGELPSGFGTGLPPGHDGYLIWEENGAYASENLRFHVYATVDFEVVA